MDTLIGKQFGSYKIISPCGEGGMAAVYKAYQANMDRYVALKVLPRVHSSNPEFIKRFNQEAQVLAKLVHPYIVPIHDYGEAEGYTYLVMPFMQDGTLADLMHGQTFTNSRIRQIISQVGDALDYAHSLGLIHRDLKPSNILMDARGNCMLTDFGIAKIMESSSEFTESGTILGTPAYMSPEQGSGKKIDQRSDIYSLGVILYELATGRVPFHAETPIAVIFKHVHEPLPPPSVFLPGINENLERIILKALAKEPENRYAAVANFVDALKALDEDTSELLSERHLLPTLEDHGQRPSDQVVELETKEHESDFDQFEIAPSSTDELLEQPDSVERTGGLADALKNRWLFILVVALVGVLTLFLLEVIPMGTTDGVGIDSTQESFSNAQKTEGADATDEFSLTSVSTSSTPDLGTHEAESALVPTLTIAPPTSTPIHSLPKLVTDLLLNPVIGFHDPFDEINQRHFAFRGGSQNWDFNNGILTLSGDQSVEWGANDPAFFYDVELQEGQAILISFKLNTDSEILIRAEGGEYRTSSLRRFGFNQWLEPAIMDGNLDGFDRSQFSHLIIREFDTWYYVLIALGRDADFSLVIWAVGDPTRVNLYRTSHGDEWSNHTWTFDVAIDTGEISLDDFTHIFFDGYVE